MKYFIDYIDAAAAFTVALLGLPLRLAPFLAAFFATDFLPGPGGLPRLPLVLVTADFLAAPGLRPRFLPGLGPRFAPVDFVAAAFAPGLRPRFLPGFLPRFAPVFATMPVVELFNFANTQTTTLLRVSEFSPESAS